MWFEKAKELISNTEGDISFVVKNLRTSEVFLHKEDEVFPSASIIKVPILMALFEQVAKGQLDINKSYTVSKAEFVGGCGIIQFMSELPYTLMDYATLMIDLSDNTATNKLIDVVGIDEVNALCSKIGLLDTILGRKLMDFEAMKQGKNNLTSGRDMLKLFEWIHFNEEKHETELKLLKQQMLNDLLPTFTERSAYEFAHKTGELSGVRHDVGIMYLQDPVFVSFLSKNLKNGLAGVRLANELGVLVAEEFGV